MDLFVEQALSGGWQILAAWLVVITLAAACAVATHLGERKLSYWLLGATFAALVVECTLAMTL